MAEKAILYQKFDSIGIIAINRPDEDNIIDTRTIAEFREVCAEINADDAMKVIIVTGAGDKMFGKGRDGTEVVESGNDLQIALLSIAGPVASLKCPTIAAINGDAIGQGLELALACDLRITSDKAHFSLPQVAAGIIPWDGATQRLHRLIGIAKATEMILTGQSITAREALQIGLVSRTVPRRDLIPVAESLAQGMVAQSPQALRFAREAINKGMDLTLEQGLRLEADLYFLLHTTADRTEGIKAFQEKRPPKFTGE